MAINFNRFIRFLAVAFPAYLAAVTAGAFVFGAINDDFDRHFLFGVVISFFFLEWICGFLVSIIPFLVGISIAYIFNIRSCVYYITGAVLTALLESERFAGPGWHDVGRGHWDAMKEFGPHLAIAGFVAGTVFWLLIRKRLS